MLRKMKQIQWIIATAILILSWNSDLQAARKKSKATIFSITKDFLKEADRCLKGYKASKKLNRRYPYLVKFRRNMFLHFKTGAKPIYQGIIQNKLDRAKAREAIGEYLKGETEKVREFLKKSVKRAPAKYNPHFQGALELLAQVIKTGHEAGKAYDKLHGWLKRGFWLKRWKKNKGKLQSLVELDKYLVKAEKLSKKYKLLPPALPWPADPIRIPCSDPSLGYHPKLEKLVKRGSYGYWVEARNQLNRLYGEHSFFFMVSPHHETPIWARDQDGQARCFLNRYTHNGSSMDAYPCTPYKKGKRLQYRWNCTNSVRPIVFAVADGVATDVRGYAAKHNNVYFRVRSTRMQTIPKWRYQYQKTYFKGKWRRLQVGAKKIGEVQTNCFSIALLHMKKLRVKRGQFVKFGEPLGLTSNAGAEKTKAHLHLEAYALDKSCCASREGYRKRCWRGSRNGCMLRHLTAIEARHLMGNVPLVNGAKPDYAPPSDIHLTNRQTGQRNHVID